MSIGARVPSTGLPIRTTVRLEYMATTTDSASANGTQCRALCALGLGYFGHTAVQSQNQRDHISVVDGTLAVGKGQTKQGMATVGVRSAPLG